MRKKYNSSSLNLLLILASLLFLQAQPLMSQCGIKYCSSCDSVKKFCFQCQLPYKPAYQNQSVCTRCANNCAVCAAQGTDSKGKCLSCQANFNFDSDDKCDTFYIWIYIVVIGVYAAFVISLVIIFCFIKKRKQRKNASWFQNLKNKYNIIDSQKVSNLQFQKMCQCLVQLLKESSSYNNLRFKDRQYEKAIKIKQIKVMPVPNQTHIKKIKIKAADNSQWRGKGYILMPVGQTYDLKIWFVKDYKNQVYSEKLSKIIIYESNYISNSQIRGSWYYHDQENINGQWNGVRQLQIQRNGSNQVNSNN